jgi:hypothetical protein
VAAGFTFRASSIKLAKLVQKNTKDDFKFGRYRRPSFGCPIIQSNFISFFYLDIRCYQL